MNAQGEIYDEQIFHVEKGSPSDGAIAVASSNGDTFYVPRLCPGLPTNRKDVCSYEYPDHASAQVLTLLNQLWGLNKTQATAPIVAPVTVINPG